MNNNFDKILEFVKVYSWSSILAFLTILVDIVMIVTIGNWSQILWVNVMPLFMIPALYCFQRANYKYDNETKEYKRLRNTGYFLIFLFLLLLAYLASTTVAIGA